MSAFANETDPLDEFFEMQLFSHLFTINYVINTCSKESEDKDIPSAEKDAWDTLPSCYGYRCVFTD